MLSINEASVIYDIEHLEEPSMASYDDILKRYQNFATKLFYTIISSPNCRYERKFGKGRIKSEIAEMTAIDRFKNVLKQKTLKGNPKGSLVNKTSINPYEVEALKSVSFTLSSMEEIREHFKHRDSEYGICFFHDFLLNKGLQKLIYINEFDPKLHNYLYFNSPHLIDIDSENYSFRWENEWRIKNELNFTPDDVAFLIVPQDKFFEIEEWIDTKLQGEYYYILPSSIFYPEKIDFLFFAHHILPIKHNSVKLNGHKKDPVEVTEFQQPIGTELAEIKLKMSTSLKCFSKSVLQGCYEYKYSLRYLSLIKNLNDATIKNMRNLHNIRTNIEEPPKVTVDLFDYCYTQLHDIQYDRVFKANNWT